jgi:hypothetical protein
VNREPVLIIVTTGAALLQALTLAVFEFVALTDGQERAVQAVVAALGAFLLALVARGQVTPMDTHHEVVADVSEVRFDQGRETAFRDLRILKESERLGPDDYYRLPSGEVPLLFDEDNPEGA